MTAPEKARGSLARQRQDQLDFAFVPGKPGFSASVGTRPGRTVGRDAQGPATSRIANCKVHTGSIDEAIPLVERAIRRSPRDPVIYWWYFEIGRDRLLESRTDEAILWLEKARSANAAHPPTRIMLASAYGLKGETQRAAAELAAARRLPGEGSFSSIARLRTRGYGFGVPKIRALYEAIVFVGLRKAGMPEE
jgi:tetratricopeptide (TPR) repeat protein